MAGAAQPQGQPTGLSTPDRRGDRGHRGHPDAPSQRHGQRRADHPPPRPRQSASPSARADRVGRGDVHAARSAAVEFDRRLRRGITDKEIEQLQDMLDRLAANVGTELDHGLPGPGLLQTGQ